MSLAAKRRFYWRRSALARDEAFPAMPNRARARSYGNQIASQKWVIADPFNHSGAQRIGDKVASHDAQIVVLAQGAVVVGARPNRAGQFPLPVDRTRTCCLHA
ncbi:hypothetical protein NC00_11565 [Xanthomonas cannabis pv. phaseoli]|uniref:Uncharacterized protein n=1 Tax=Xanthomonas cannabis pv. phaseoli TaxID=1885902 RepID=A0AB34PA63_9XANT|nr:hypothetical protein NC00_11565 [Xanthomonas cannabis pv. phaseoli]